MANLVLKNINKIYDNNVQAVFDFNLEIEDKEFIVFVGPSGCGKSTTLRMVAGLEEISAGDLLIDDKRVNDVAPKDRDIAMVFQSYALYPHMTVYENMAFGLKLRKIPKHEIDTRVKEAAEILELSDYLDRRPKQLSGGQRQRVALGRAIVRNPKVFLMDEPLSNLDAKLRVQMRSQIASIHKRIGTTTIYVTHDQTEAMTMASRIVVMKDGYIQQIGTPKDIYNNPVNMFVGGFMGAPAMNFIKGTYSKGVFTADYQAITLTSIQTKLLEDFGYDDEAVVLGIRPEDVHTEQTYFDTYPDACFKLEVTLSELLGHEIIVHGNFGDQPIISKLASRENINYGDKVDLVFDLNKVHFFDPKSQSVIKYEKKKKTFVEEPETLEEVAV